MPFEDPRKVGGRYYSGQYRREYVVRGMRGALVSLRWSDGKEGLCVLPWDLLNDKVISQPTEVTA